MKKKITALPAAVFCIVLLAPATAAPVNTVAEIKRFKDLLEQGVITEEEFAAKKRQLLGILGGKT